MTITYKRPFSDRTTRVPILHKVCYGPAGSIGQQPTHNVAVYDWCKENCRAAWYMSPGYVNQCFIEFEDDEDAVMFALRWA